MIVYALRCDAGHQFDAWFRNSDAFETQAAQGNVSCPDCGSNAVRKALMTPNLGRTARGAAGREDPAASPPVPVPSQTTADASLPALLPDAVDMRAQFRRKLIELRQIIEKNCDDVGSKFAEEARKIHYRETDPRGIYGTATPEDAEALRDEGIEFGALPWPNFGDN